jgi:hypothetical protein
MTRMVCWNEVKDFAAWKAAFDADTDTYRAAGLTLEALWRDIDDPDEIIYIFQVSDFEKARAFVSEPSVLEKAHLSGVTDGSIWFVQ